MKYRNPGPPERMPHEDPKFEIPDRHTHGGKGTVPSGPVVVNQVYRQPWVENDGVTDPHGKRNDG